MTQPPYPPPPPGDDPQQGYPQPADDPLPEEPRRSRAPLYLAVAVVLLAAIGAGVYFGFFAGGRGYDTPAKAADALMSAAKARDIDGVKDALCTTDQALAAQIGGSDKGDVRGYTIGATTTRDASHASVHVTVVTSDGTEDDDLPVSKTGDGWLVCVSDLLKELPTSLPTS